MVLKLPGLLMGSLFVSCWEGPGVCQQIQRSLHVQEAWVLKFHETVMFTSLMPVIFQPGATTSQPPPGTGRSHCDLLQSGLTLSQGDGHEFQVSVFFYGARAAGFLQSAWVGYF